MVSDMASKREVRKNLLVLTSTFPRWEGDSEPRFIYDLCSRLSSHFNVIVLAPHVEEAMREELTGNIKIYRYRYAPDSWEKLAYEGGITASLRDRKLNWILLPTFILSQFLAIRKIIKREDIDIIHAHWIIPQGMLAIACRFMLNKKPKIICTSHGADLFCLTDPVSKMIKRWVINRVDGMSVVSNIMVTKVAELSSTKSELCTVIPMGTDSTSTFIVNPDKNRKRFQLLFVGRLVEKKGLRYLVECLPFLLKKFPEIKLKVAGSGPEQIVLELLVDKLGLSSRIDFLGRVSHQNLVNLYQESTMAIFPFIQAEDGDMEGLGLVMVEALACQCPVIAGDVPAVKDVIENELSGLIIDPKHTDLLEHAISRMLNDREQAQEMARCGREYVHGKFSWESVSSSYIELLDTAGSP